MPRREWPRQGPAIFGTDQIPQLARTFELAKRHKGPRRSFGRQLHSEVTEVLDPIEKNKGPEPLLLPDQLTAVRFSPKNRGGTVCLRPHRDDAGGVVPSPQPFILDRPPAHLPRLPHFRV